MNKRLLLMMLAVFVVFLIPQAHAQDVNPVMEEGMPAPYPQEYLDWVNSTKRLKGQDSDSDTAYYGLTPMPVDLSHLKDNPPKIPTLTELLPNRYTSVQVPSAYDLRSYNLLPAVRNQNPFGTCWAFSAIGAMESNYMKNYPNAGTPDLSEMHLAWFVYKDPAEGKAQATHDIGSSYTDFILDQGGNPGNAIAFMSRMSGPVNESALPYPTKKSIFGNLTDTGERPADGATPEDYGSAVMRLTDAAFYSDSSSAEIDSEIRKRLIMDKGAIQAAYYDVHSMYTETGGTMVFFNNTTGTNTNHAVLIVGWDDNFSRENFPESMRPESNGAWLVRNSWGSNWGNDGYFWISYEQYMKYAVAYTVKTDSPKAYVYDDLGWTSSYSYNWGANVFQAGDTDEKVTGVGFYTTDNNAPYKIYVYDLGKTKPEKPIPSDVTEMTPTASGTMTYAGYHTVELENPIAIPAGHYFSVVMRIDQAEGSTYRYVFAVERNTQYYPAVYHSGESYFCSRITSGGNEVMPVGNYLSYWKETDMNACIKAFTAGTDSGIAVDAERFPDNAFRSYVSTNFDKDKNGILNTSEIAAVTKIDVNSKGIASLNGIEYFTGLVSLDCRDNRLASFDVSSNRALEYLDCSLSSLSGTVNLMYSLNVSSNTALKYLDCSGRGLDELDVSSNTALEELYCSGNNLTQLDVSSNKALVTLSCSGNTLENLDVTNNSALRELFCADCGLGKLDVSSCPALTDLSCPRNNLEALVVGNNPLLEYLDCSENLITELDLSGNAALKSLYCGGNNLVYLNAENIGRPDSALAVDLGTQTILLGYEDTANKSGYPYCINLNTLKESMSLTVGVDEFMPRVTVLKLRDKNNVSVDMYADSSAGIVYFKATPKTMTYHYDAKTQIATSYIQPRFLTVNVGFEDEAEGVAVDSANFPDSYFRAYVSNKFDTDGNGYLSSAEIASANEIKITAATSMTTSYYLVKSFEGIQYFTALTSLEISDGYITSLDVSGITSLQTLKCLNNNQRLTAITLGSLPNLTYLNCSNNETISALDVSGCPKLKTLQCGGNQITELDVSNNPDLQTLNCWENKLTELDVSHNPELRTLICNKNNITVLDISNNPYLILAVGTTKLQYDSGVTLIDGTSTAVPQFKTHSLLLSGQIGVNFYMNLPEISGVDYADSYMDFSIAGDSSNPPQYFDSEFMNKKRTYYGFRCYIKSVQMADKINAVFHYGDNKTVTHEYSAEKYLNDSLAADIPDVERALIEAIKDFGHYAQLYLSRVNGWELGTAHKAIDCENEYSDSDIEAARQAVDSNAIVKDIPADSGVKRVGFSLNLDADTTINLYIYPEDGYTGSIAAYISGSTANNAIYQSDRNRYKVEISNIPAHRLAETFTVRVVGKKEFDVKVSAFSYAYAALNDANAQRDEIDTVVSLYRYYTTNMNYRAANGL